jgi:hypothetical protein
MTETDKRFDDIVHEYIDLVNAQVGAYMDALAGFTGHHVRIERQVHRVMRPQKHFDSKDRKHVVVCTSYEDPTRPDVVLNRIIRADDYITINAHNGSNEEQQAKSTLIFLFTFWELEIRPRLAIAKGVPENDIISNIMGDLREVRHAILHARGKLALEKYRKLKVLDKIFSSQPTNQTELRSNAPDFCVH